MKKRTTFKKTLFYLLVIIIAFLIQFLIHWPDLVGWQNTPENMVYSGQTSWFDPWDINVYFAAINWGQRGGLLFKNVYTTDNQPRALIYTTYTLLGRLNRLIQTDPRLIFHLSSIVLGLLVLPVIYKITQLVANKQAERLALLTLLLLGGGLGWLFSSQLIGADITATTFTLFSCLRRPHEIISSGLYLTNLYLIFLILQKDKNHLPMSVFLFAGSCFFHFYIGLLIGLVTLSLAVVRWQETKNIRYLKLPLAFFLIGISYALLIWRSFIANPAFAGLLHYQKPPPSFLSLIIGFGFLTPFVILALLQKSQDDQELRFLKTWFLVQLTALYLPFNFKRLLVRCLFVPGVFLAVKGLKRIIKDQANYWPIFIILIIFSSFSSFFIFSKRIQATKTQNPWIYIPQAQASAMEFLKQKTPEESHILSSYLTGNLIPAHTKQRVFVGHEFQTPNFEEKLRKTILFYQSKSNTEQAIDFLKKNQIDYVFYGPEEQVLANNQEFPYQFLEKIFENQTVQIFKLN